MVDLGRDTDETVDEVDEADGPSRSPLTVVLAVVAVVAVLAIAATAGYLVRGNGSSGSSVSASSVDAGFARDMSTHHTQAVTMAGYERDNTTDSALKILAYDIETSQQFELGRMSGWLDVWGLSRESTEPQMAWMAGHAHLESDGLMPGMATGAQMDKLITLHGTALDIFFLQLMIHHHQGGLPMAQYAEQHATQPFVRAAAQAMVTVQSNEIIEMEQMLRQLGGSPLPAPAS